MKIILKQILFSGILILMIASCSKEKKVSRTLTKKDGSWKISQMDWESVSQDTSGQHINMGSSSDNGTFVFEKDNGGTYSFEAGGNSYNQSFSWSVNEEDISITKISQSFDFSGSITQLAVAFTGERIDKKTIRLEGSETYQATSGVITQKVLTASIVLTLE